MARIVQGAAGMVSLDRVFEDQLDRIQKKLAEAETRYVRRCHVRRAKNRPTLQEMDANTLVGSIAGTSMMGTAKPTLDYLDMERR